MLLPGGIAGPSGLDRRYAFKPLTGRIELSIAEGLEAGENWPRRVTGALAAALETVGGRDADPETIHDLAVGDRQFLARRLGILLRGDDAWLTGACEACGEPFHVPVRHSELPVKVAGEGFPHVEARTSLSDRPLRFRAPSGRDQEVIQALPDPMEARETLARLLLADDAARDLAGRFSGPDLDAIEKAVEEMAPEIGTRLEVTCPTCEERGVVTLDPCLPLRGDLAGPLLLQVDQLAWHYHWSESDILALPRQRRRRYLALIDHRRGMRTANTLRDLAGAADQALPA